jgi:hypothetical protein
LRKVLLLTKRINSRNFLFINIIKEFIIKTISVEGVNQMKKLNALSITLLLTFLTFSILHISNGPFHSHPESKAVIVLDDWHLQSQMDEEEKHLFYLHFIVLLAAILSIVIILIINFSRDFDRKIIFLMPIFHQSNYVILTPKL